MGPVPTHSFILLKIPQSPCELRAASGVGTQVSRQTKDAVALSSWWAARRRGGGRAGTALGPEREPRTRRGMQAGGPASRLWGVLQLHRHASPSGQRLSSRSPPLPGLRARAPAGGALGASLPGCGRGRPLHAGCPCLSQSVLASSSPKDSSPSGSDHPHDPIRPELPIEDSYFQICAHSEVWGVRSPSAPKTRGNVEQGTAMIRFALQLTSPRQAGSSPRLHGEGGPVRRRETVGPGLAGALMDQEQGPGRRPRCGQRRGQRGEVCLRGVFQSCGLTTLSSRCPS